MLQKETDDFGVPVESGEQHRRIPVRVYIRARVKQRSHAAFVAVGSGVAKFEIVIAIISFVRISHSIRRRHAVPAGLLVTTIPQFWHGIGRRSRAQWPAAVGLCPTAVAK